MWISLVPHTKTRKGQDAKIWFIRCTEHLEEISCVPTSWGRRQLLYILAVLLLAIRRIPDGNGAGRGGSVKIKSHSLKIKWTLRGSFSAVSTPIFSSKYSLESSWRDLQDLHAFALLRSQYFSKDSFFFGVFHVRNAKTFTFFQNSSWFSLILMKFARIKFSQIL